MIRAPWDLHFPANQFIKPGKPESTNRSELASTYGVSLKGCIGSPRAMRRQSAE